MARDVTAEGDEMDELGGTAQARDEAGRNRDSAVRGAPLTVLITDARAAFALELARHLHAGGHRVLVADSIRFPLARFSEAAAGFFQLPAPATDVDGFTAALARIVDAQGVDLVIPAAESVFHVARGRHALPAHCTSFVADLEILRTAHDKWLFNQHARSLGLSAPDTTLLTSTDDALKAFDGGEELVLKPAYSRFAAHTLIRPTRRRQVSSLPISGTRPWVAQAFVEGRAVNTYGVAHRGRVTAHSAYTVHFALGQGAAIAAESIDHPAARRWVDRYVDATGFTGQIAFDFIERRDGSISAIECNPRATSGVHFFEPSDNLCGAILNRAREPVLAKAGRMRMGKALMRSVAPRLAFSPRELRRWLRVYRASADIVGHPDDRRPERYLVIANGAFFWRSLRHRVTVIEASSMDIEWNGDLASSRQSLDAS